MTTRTRQHLEVVAISTVDEKVDAKLEGVEKIVFQTTRLVVFKDGKPTPYAPQPNQYFVVIADGQDCNVPTIVVGDVRKICTYLVSIEGASFLRGCGEPAVSGDRCGEHQGR